MREHRAGTTRRARMLRRTSTAAEHALWALLRDHRFKGVKFRRQFPLGNYIVDFVCLSARLIVEADGAHHGLASVRDALRDEWLESRGFTILRFSNHEILTTSQSVLDTINRALLCTANRKE